MFNTGPAAMTTAPVMHHDTRAWKAQVWISFALAATLTRCDYGMIYR